MDTIYWFIAVVAAQCSGSSDTPLRLRQCYPLHAIQITNRVFKQRQVITFYTCMFILIIQHQFKTFGQLICTQYYNHLLETMFQVPPNSVYFLDVPTVSLVIQQLIHLPYTVTQDLLGPITITPPNLNYASGVSYPRLLMS